MIKAGDWLIYDKTNRSKSKGSEYSYPYQEKVKVLRVTDKGYYVEIENKFGDRIRKHVSRHKTKKICGRA